jgi:repressor LexA
VLKDNGYILAEPGKKRSWRFSKNLSGGGVPLIGSIDSGRPLEAIE